MAEPTPRLLALRAVGTRRRQPWQRSEGGAQPPNALTRPIGPQRQRLAPVVRYPLGDQFPGNALALMLQGGQGFAGLPEDIVAPHPAFGTLGMQQRLVPGIQAGEVASDLVG